MDEFSSNDNLLNKIVQYSFFTDARSKQLDGTKYYKFQLSANKPSCNFWSLIVYDCETDFMIRTDQSWPSVHSSCKGLDISPDGSVDAWFGPNSPTGLEQNWIKTIPGKNWYLILRLYDISENGNDKLWRPGEIKIIK